VGALIRKLWQFRGLTTSLVQRQYQLRYRQSVVGFAWAVLPPLITLGAANLVFHRVAQIQTGSVPYVLYTMAALVPWTYFANGLTYGVPSIVSAQQMVSRMAFPRAALPLSNIGLAILDLLIASALYVVMALGLGWGIPLTALWFFVLFVIETLLITGLVLLGSALNVFARDIRLALPLMVQLWLFLTPVMYGLNSVPQALRSFYLANPMTGLVESFREVMLFGREPKASLLLPSVIGALASFAIGLWYFTATEDRLADAI
jgi:lipopolysaccharide transport system permease protein